MTERKIDHYADSSVLKLLNHVVTAIMLPGLIWFGNRMLGDIDDTKKAAQKAETFAATSELRLTSLEKGQSDTASAIRLLTEQSLKNSYDIRRIEDRMWGTRPPASPPPGP